MLAADKAEALGLDLARFDRYERDTVVRAAGRVDLEALLSSSASVWEGFHDWFFPPHCVWRVDRPPTVVFCEGCPSPERVAESHFVERAFDDLARQAADVHQQSDSAALGGPGFQHERLLRLWPETRRRAHIDRCPRSDGWSAAAWKQSIDELRSARHSGDFEQLQRLLALPYWQHRWQLYEVWLLGVVLDLIGLDRLALVLNDGQRRLPVGSVAAQPVAHVVGPVTAEVLYQHQGTPPQPLFAGAQDRPEILIRTTGDRGGRVLLAAEAKARRALTRGDVEGFTYPLLMWQPAIALFAGYFPIGNLPPLSASMSGSADVLVAVNCRPDTGLEAELRGRLGPLLARELAPPLCVVVCDVSESMPDVSPLVRSLGNQPPATTTILVAFAQRAAIVPSGVVADAHELSLGGATNLSSASEVVSAVVRDRLAAGGGELHLVTDLELEVDQLAAFASLVDALGVRLLIHTWNRARAERATTAIPLLIGRMNVLDGPPTSAADG
jgi:hypothetical protein